MSTIIYHKLVRDRIPEIIRQASLKETSLFDLALRCGLSSGQQFVERFIDYERRMTGRW